MQLTLPVAAWAVWKRTADTAPDIGFVEPMLRRRLGPLARMALDVATRCLGERTGIPMVFASRHGELERTLGLLRELAAAGPLSPTAFSLSVHNAAAGVLSIARQDMAASTAIAAGEASFGQALIEAASRLAASPEKPVLMVYADDPIPAEYARFVAGTESAHAIGLLLEASARKHIEMRITPQPQTTAATEMQSLAFLRIIDGVSEHATWRDTAATWEWRLNHAD